MDENVGFEEQVRVLWKRRWIVASVFLAVFSAIMARSLLASRVYEATAGVAIVRIGYSVDSAPAIRIREGIDERLTGSAADPRSRRLVLVALVQNGEVARRVVESAPDELNLAATKPADLAASITGQLRDGEQIELIEIVARADTGRKAMLLANAWATEFEGYVNEIYRATFKDLRTTVQEQTLKAERHLEEAERALLGFLEDNRIDELRRSIQETEQLIARMQAGRQQAVEEYVSTIATSLSESYAKRATLARYMEDATALREHIEAGGALNDKTTARLRVLLLEAQMRAPSDSVASGIRQRADAESSPPATRRQQLNQLAEIIDAIDEKIAVLDEVIAVQNAQLQSGGGISTDGPRTSSGSGSATWRLPVAPGPGTPIELLERNLGKMRADLERELIQQHELTRQRELAREAHEVLAREAAELAIASELASKEVMFVDPAVEPNVASAPKTLTDLQIGLIAGLLLGVVAAFVVEAVRAPQQG